MIMKKMELKKSLKMSIYKLKNSGKGSLTLINEQNKQLKQVSIDLQKLKKSSLKVDKSEEKKKEE